MPPSNGTLWMPFPREGVPTAAVPVLLNTVDFDAAPVMLADIVVSQGTVPENTIDDDLSTFWRASCGRPIGEFDEWIRYDLSEAIDIDRIKMAWDATEETEFRIETSMDGTNWQVAHEAVTSGPGAVLTLYPFDSRKARQIRVYFGRHANTASGRGRAFISDLTKNSGFP